MVARAVGGGRQRLERRFRAVLDRSVQEEIRRARVEAARHWLSATSLSMAEVAKRSGFTSASLLNVAFRRELGMPPGEYRRRTKGEFGTQTLTKHKMKMPDSHASKVAKVSKGDA